MISPTTTAEVLARVQTISTIDPPTATERHHQATYTRRLDFYRKSKLLTIIAAGRSIRALEHAISLKRTQLAADIDAYVSTSDSPEIDRAELPAIVEKCGGLNRDRMRTLCRTSSFVLEGKK